MDKEKIINLDEDELVSLIIENFRNGIRDPRKLAENIFKSKCPIKELSKDTKQLQKENGSLRKQLEDCEKERGIFKRSAEIRLITIIQDEKEIKFLKKQLATINKQGGKMELEKELRKILLITIKGYQHSYDSANEEAEYEGISVVDGPVLTQESVKRFIQAEKTAIDYGTKEIMELIKRKEYQNI
jgi:hypothetical protein